MPALRHPALSLSAAATHDHRGARAATVLRRGGLAAVFRTALGPMAPLRGDDRAVDPRGGAYGHERCRDGGGADRRPLRQTSLLGFEPAIKAGIFHHSSRLRKRWNS